MISKVIELSTAHMPNSRPTTGTLRASSHSYGLIVFVCPSADNVPYWLKTIHDDAVKEGATIINFDCDAELDVRFPTYSW